MEDRGGDGGPAFPVVMHGRVGTNDHPGLSLRDYFAAAALQGYLSAPGRDAEHARQSPSDVSHWAYDQADAMLAARGSK